MKKHISSIIIGLVFLAGLSVLLYPLVSDFINSRSQSKVIASYVENVQSLDNSAYEAVLREARDYNDSLEPGLGRFSVKDQALEDYHHLLGADGAPIGYIDIEKIQVSLPIYLGDSDLVLQVGAGTMPGASLPIGGPGTHAVLTGHRGLPTSKLFTDLDQMEVGDTFVIHVLEETLTYQVDQIKIVLPEEMEELELQEDRDLCTLITCTPYGVNSHRMLVRGTRIDNIVSQEKTYRVMSDAVQITPMKVAPVVAAPLILVLVLVAIFGKPRKDED